MKSKQPTIGKFGTLFQSHDLRPSGKRPRFLGNVRRLIDGKWRWVKVFESQYDMMTKWQKRLGVYWEGRKPPRKLKLVSSQGGGE